MEGGKGRVGERLEQTWYHATIAVCMDHMKGKKYAWPAGNYNLTSPVMSVSDWPSLSVECSHSLDLPVGTYLHTTTPHTGGCGAAMLCAPGFLGSQRD